SYSGIACIERERQTHQGLKVKIRRAIPGEDQRSHLELERQRHIVLEKILDTAAEQDREHELSVVLAAGEDDEHRQLEGQTNVQLVRGTDPEREPDRNRHSAQRRVPEEIHQRPWSEINTEIELPGVHQICPQQALKLEARPDGGVHVPFKTIVKGEDAAEVELGGHAMEPSGRNSWPARLYLKDIHVR